MVSRYDRPDRGRRSNRDYPGGRLTSRREDRPVQPGGQVDMQALLAQAQQMQEAVMAAQAEIAAAEVEGEAGNGLVRVTIKATGEIQSMRIDPKVVDPSDIETLQDLVVGAVNDAMANAQELAAQKLGPLAGGMGGGSMPGLPL
ncbi:YbaB/EbfC family nucleoid-associated protein [Nocardia terpenica]